MRASRIRLAVAFEILISAQLMRCSASVMHAYILIAKGAQAGNRLARSLSRSLTLSLSHSMCTSHVRAYAQIGAGADIGVLSLSVGASECTDCVAGKYRSTDGRLSLSFACDAACESPRVIDAQRVPCPFARQHQLQFPAKQRLSTMRATGIQTDLPLSSTRILSCSVCNTVAIGR